MALLELQSVRAGYGSGPDILTDVSIDVEAGDHVARGELIGASGATGLAGGDHLAESCAIREQTAFSKYATHQANIRSVFIKARWFSGQAFRHISFSGAVPERQASRSTALGS